MRVPPVAGADSQQKIQLIKENGKSNFVDVSKLTYEFSLITKKPPVKELLMRQT